MRHRLYLIIIIILTCAAIPVVAQESDTLLLAQADSTQLSSKKKELGIIKVAKKVIKFFSPDPDHNYIEPQKYNFSTMAQMSRTDDSFEITGDDGQSLSFAPNSKLKIGPYFGWRWLFFGYTFTVKNIDLDSKGVDVNTSLYTPAVCIDFLYRNLSEAYKIKKIKTSEMGKAHWAEGLQTDAFDVDILSLTAFYSFNSKKYSQQAVFSQSNRQIRSAGSLIVGTGYHQSRISMDWDRFYDDVKDYAPEGKNPQKSDTTLFFKKIAYRSIPFSVGYGYNWAFAKNWAAGVQFIGSLSYMWSKGSAYDEKVAIHNVIKNFNFSNFTLDGTIRLGVVWNNSRWYAGANTIYHTYHYHQKNLQADNIFGTANIYVGFNFWRR